jgi:GTP cyclohydrolase-4
MDPDRKCRPGRDTQQARPAVGAALSRVGVTNLRRIIAMKGDGKSELFYAVLDLYADLSPEQAGVHMSRFSEVVEDLAEGLTRAPFADIESLAGRMAQDVVATQGALRAEVHIRAQSPITKLTPVTQRPTEQLYTLVGIAAATRSRTRLLVGIEVNGLTVCPCAQDMVHEHSVELLVDEGYGEEEAERIVRLLPMASHNQRGKGTLVVGSDQRLRAEDLLRIAEQSMSSEIYELLKRPDELAVVLKAHHNPRFVEDVVRQMLDGVCKEFGHLSEDTFVLARQENFEGIHEHNAFAERFGTLAEIRPEIAGHAYAEHHTSQSEWLYS